MENINLTRLNNSEHIALERKIETAIEKYNAEDLNIKPLYDQYLPLQEAEEAALKVLQASPDTALVSKADRTRDNAGRMLNRYIENFYWSNDPDEVYTAHQLQIVLKDMSKIIDLPQEQETVQISKVVRQLAEEPFVSYIARLGAENLLQGLVDTNNEFDALSKQRSDDNTAKGSGNVNAARKQTDVVIRKIFGATQSLVDMYPESQLYQDFATAINTAIKETRTDMHRRLGRKGGDDEPGEKPEE